MYITLKTIHISCVALTFVLFTLRAGWMLRGDERLQARWVRIAPHIIDTTLLASAIGLSLKLEQYPLTHDWLTAKILALLVYIVLGSVAIRRGKSRTIRIYGLIGAYCAFAYILAVALSHHPWPPMGL